MPEKRKLAEVVASLVMKASIEYAKKKNIPCFKYESMLESVKNRLFQIEAEMLGDDMDDDSGD